MCINLIWYDFQTNSKIVIQMVNLTIVLCFSVFENVANNILFTAIANKITDNDRNIIFLKILNSNLHVNNITPKFKYRKTQYNC